MNEYNIAIEMIHDRIKELGMQHRITIATIEYWAKILNVSKTELLIKAVDKHDKDLEDACLHK